MLQQIRDANPEAGTQFLEHLVLQKRSTVRPLLPTFLFFVLTRARTGSDTTHRTRDHLRRPTPLLPVRRRHLEALARQMSVATFHDRSAD